MCQVINKVQTRLLELDQEHYGFILYFFDFKGIHTEVTEKFCWAEFLKSSGTVTASVCFDFSC